MGTERDQRDRRGDADARIAVPSPRASVERRAAVGAAFRPGPANVRFTRS